MSTASRSRSEHHWPSSPTADGGDARLARADRRQQRAVADEVRVAADRRGEMAVARRAQPGVAEVARRVVGLLERAQDERAERAPAASAGAHVAFDELRDLADEAPRLRRGEVLGDRRRRHLERDELLDEPLDARGLGLLVDAVEGRLAALGEHGRDLLVGGDHQVLDQAVGLRLLGRADRAHVAGAVESELGLGAGDLERAAPHPLLAERARRGRAPPRAARPTAPAACSAPAKMRSTVS